MFKHNKCSAPAISSYMVSAYVNAIVYRLDLNRSRRKVILIEILLQNQNDAASRTVLRSRYSNSYLDLGMKNIVRCI